MTKDEAYKEYFDHWVSGTGLGRLELSDSEPWGTSETVLNENGILFLAYFLMVCELSHVDIESHRLRFIETVRSLEVEPGLYNRRPYYGKPSPRLEAQDNYAAIQAMSVYWNLAFSMDIYDYGENSGYNYNNVQPGMPILSQQRQGGEIAFYKYCAKKKPAPWELAWLLGGVTLGIFFDTGPSTTLLTLLRLWALQHRNVTFLKPVGIIWTRIMKKRYGGLNGLMKRYFKPEHPIIAMSEGL